MKGHWKNLLVPTETCVLASHQTYLIFSSEKIDFHRAAQFSLKKACKILATRGTKDTREGKQGLHDDLAFYTIPLKYT